MHLSVFKTQIETGITSCFRVRTYPTDLNEANRNSFLETVGEFKDIILAANPRPRSSYI